MMKIIVILLLLMAIETATASPRLWPSYSNRWDRAELVAIGRFQKTEDTHETNTVARIPAVGVLSDFKLLLVLKGDCTQGVVRVAHYRRRDPPDALAFVKTTVGPSYSFVRFEDLIDLVNRPTEADYVLFLAHSPEEGVWFPATGRVDPEWSFLKLSQYWMTEERKRAAEQQGGGYSPPAARPSKPTP